MTMARKLFRSSALLVAIRFFQRSLGLISTLILARVLTPADFGIVAVAALIIHFSEVLSNTGIQQYLVQTPEVSDEVVNTAWTLDLLLKFSVCVLLYILVPAINWFYDDPNIIYAVAALIPVIAIRSLLNPELHVHRRNLRYGVIFRIGVIQKLTSFVVVIAVAFSTKSFWAIVIGDLVSSLVAVSLSYYYCRGRPRISVLNIKSQWVFSRWMLARGSVGYMRSQIDTLLISQFYSLSQLGKFNIAREFTVMPAKEIIEPAVEPLLATFSTVRTDYGKLGQQVSLSLLLISSFTAPFVGFIYFFYEPIIFYLLGEQWMEAAPLMQAMTPLLFAFALGGTLNNLCFALAKVKVVFWYDLLSLALISVVLVAAEGYAIIDFVWLRSFLGLAVIAIFLYVCSRLISARYAMQVCLLLTPLGLSFALGIAADELFFRETFLSLVGSGLAFSASYVIVMLLIARCLSPFSPAWASVLEYSSKIIQKLKTTLSNRPRSS
ncbi:MAG: oligosaccharide flippase family protein [Rickettsiales bacterium]